MGHSTIDGQHGKATQMSDNLSQISQDNRGERSVARLRISIWVYLSREFTEAD